MKREPLPWPGKRHRAALILAGLACGAAIADAWFPTGKPSLLPPAVDELVVFVTGLYLFLAILALVLEIAEAKRCL